jgi:beta-ureidopropionase / N-carbamoyl-L-amino-acid hydrolase
MPTRRGFLSTAMLPVGLALTRATRPAALQTSDYTRLRVDSGALRQDVEGLSQFGRPRGGSFADGVTRTGYSQADVDGRSFVMAKMRAAGLAPRIDAGGNIFARRAGSDAFRPPILFGSHIDSVVSGGNFDGDLGSLAALEVVRALEAAGVRTRYPLEIVIWANEEGGAYQPSLGGSRLAVGELNEGELEVVVDGVSKRDAIARIGGDVSRLAESRLAPGAYAGYVELHIEQGGNLDREGLKIGVVEGIVTVDRHEVTIDGFANHAGTTPMGERSDALLAAAHLTIAVNDTARSEPGRQVGTVGRLQVFPNAPNVIPGRVIHTIELRDLSPQMLSRMTDRIEARAREIAAATRTTISFRRVNHNEGASADPKVQRAIEHAATALGLSHVRMPSGAGHDAQMAARLCPMGMIFVPSVAGISHSPKELTSWDDCANGANALLHTVLALDNR